jgi:hypothetical protein
LLSSLSSEISNFHFLNAGKPETHLLSTETGSIVAHAVGCLPRTPISAARWQSCIRHSLPRADEPSPQRADSSRTSSSPKGEVRQRSTFPVMGPLKVSVAYDPTNRLRSSLPQSYTQARIEVSTSPMEPWRLTWRVMNLPRTGPCGSSTWWDRWILRTRAPGVRRSVGPSRLDRISQRLPVLGSRRQSSFALEHELEGSRPY